MDQFNTDSFMMMFEAIIGVYLVYSAVVGRGAAYKDENIKEDKKEEFHRVMRWFCAIFGPVSLAQAAFDYYRMSVWSTITLIVFGVGIVALFVYVLRITDRKKRTQ